MQQAKMIPRRTMAPAPATEAAMATMVVLGGVEVGEAGHSELLAAI